MAKAARNAYRDAVHDAKAFIVRRERERVYEKQRNLTVLAGFGLSFVMLGGPVVAVAEHHVEEIDRKIAELRGMRDALTHLMERCHGDDRPDCPILDDLAGTEVDEIVN